MCALKIVTENMQVLHRNLRCDTFFADHPVFGEFYDMVQGMLDEVIEVGLALGKKEPTFAEAIASKACVLIPATDRDCPTSYKIAYDNFTKLIAAFKDDESIAPPFVANKFQEYEELLFKEAEYKINRAIK